LQLLLLLTETVECHPFSCAAAAFCNECCNGR
jgi:hypothetical protein